jgi:hypothetical protein
MDHNKQLRLETALDGGRWRPFARDDQEAIERQLGRAVPVEVRHVWTHFGGGTIPSSSVVIYDADEVVDLLEQYSDFGLVNLLPLACDGGSLDFAIDLVGRHGRPAGTILLNGRGTMTEESLRPAAADVIELVELARGGARWTPSGRARS